MRARAVALHGDAGTLPAELVVGDAPRAAVVLCHGLPGGAEHARDPNDRGYADLARAVAARGFAALWFDFRGVRASPGDFSAAGWVRDLEAALDALDRDRTARELPRIVAGSSAGGAVALAAAARRSDVSAVATMGTPATFRGLATDPEDALARLRNVGIIRDPAFPRDPSAWWAEFEQVRAESLVASMAPRPLLIVHGDADDVVPYEHAERLFAAARPVKELARLPGAGHQLRREPRGVACLLDWLDRTAPAAS